MVDGLILDGTHISEFNIIAMLEIFEDAAHMLVHVWLLPTMDEQA